MKLVKLKNKKVIRKIVLSLLFVGFGFGLHMYLTPDYAAMMQANQEPFVSVKGLNYLDISEKKKFIATVEAINSVDLIPQVSGYVEEVLFQDGSYVKEGDVLFVIEQSKFQADVAAAEANLEKAKSDLIQIESDYKRKSELYKDKFTSKADLEVAEKQLSQAKSNIKQAEANLTIAQINLGYSEIKAPISGFIGKALISKGNYVNPNVQRLARIVQMDPIRVAFSVSDKERLRFMDNLKDKTDDVHFEIVYPNGETEEISVQNIFADNEINPETATVSVYVDYPNPDKRLIPGNYVDILVRIGSREKALVVPLTALAQDVNGSYVMAINDENVVEQKYVELGRVFKEYQEVKSGLADTDKVIVQGIQKVRPGLKVKPILVQE